LPGALIGARTVSSGPRALSEFRVGNHRSKLRWVTDWSTIASIATAGGTLALAVATFASIRSANRSARISERAARTAEQSLLVGERPLLVNSRLQDPTQKTQYREGVWLQVDGGTAVLEVTDDVVYLAVSIRNVGTGLAVLHGWQVQAGVQTERSRPPLEEFTTQNLDIYVAPGDKRAVAGGPARPVGRHLPRRGRRGQSGPTGGDQHALRRLRGRTAGHHPVLPAPLGRALARAGGQAFQRGPARSSLGHRGQLGGEERVTAGVFGCPRAMSVTRVPGG
jgi:hypothetical protein